MAIAVGPGQPQHGRSKKKVSMRTRLQRLFKNPWLYLLVLPLWAISLAVLSGCSGEAVAPNTPVSEIAVTQGPSSTTVLMKTAEQQYSFLAPPGFRVIVETESEARVRDANIEKAAAEAKSEAASLFAKVIGETASELQKEAQLARDAATAELHKFLLENAAKMQQQQQPQPTPVQQPVIPTGGKQTKAHSARLEQLVAVR